MTIVYTDNETTQALRPPTDDDKAQTLHGHIWRDLTDHDGQYLFMINKFVKIGGNSSNDDMTKLEQLVNDLTLRVEELEQINKDTFTD